MESGLLLQATPWARTKNRSDTRLTQETFSIRATLKYANFSSPDCQNSNWSFSITSPHIQVAIYRGQSTFTPAPRFILAATRGESGAVSPCCSSFHRWGCLSNRKAGLRSSKQTKVRGPEEWGQELDWAPEPGLLKPQTNPRRNHSSSHIITYTYL